MGLRLYGACLPNVSTGRNPLVRQYAKTSIKMRIVWLTDGTLAARFWRVGGIPKWPTGADCKSAGIAFESSNLSPTTMKFETLLRQGLFSFLDRGFFAC